ERGHGCRRRLVEADIVSIAARQAVPGLRPSPGGGRIRRRAGASDRFLEHLISPGARIAEAPSHSGAGRPSDRPAPRGGNSWARWQPYRSPGDRREGDQGDAGTANRPAAPWHRKDRSRGGLMNATNSITLLTSIPDCRRYRGCSRTRRRPDVARITLPE